MCLLNKESNVESVTDRRYVKNREDKSDVVTKKDQRNIKGKISQTGITNRNFITNQTNDGDPSFTGTVFDGIFNHLRQINQINSSVRINFSSDGCGFDVMKLLQYNNRDFSFYTRDMPNSWICFNFIRCKVSVTHYTIRTDKWNKVGGNHPRSWVIEGFNGYEWEIIDERINDNSLNGEEIVQTFAVQKNTNKMYSAIRMRLTDTNWNNKNYLMLNSIELYGNITR